MGILGKRTVGRQQAVGGVGLHGALTVIGRVEVEVAGQEAVHSLHLAEEEGADAVVMGVGMVEDGIAHSVVASFGGGDIEDVNPSLTVDHKPLVGTSIVGFQRFNNGVATPPTRNQHQSGQ